MRAVVSGPSMVPLLRHGDALLARTDARVRPGDVVLGRFRSLPGTLVVKRVTRAHGDGWWFASDNPFAGGDSETHGVADVVARVIVRRRGWRLRLIRRVAATAPADVQDSPPRGIPEH